ncbi:hypothetical protein H7K28_15055 [Paenibacillus polymyxa]|mgnify:CR=1 FL=1|nr:hypothetical protein [Paenibacillus polymyxa]MBY0024527.1 hypothetical protein [Paenibacillus polymyxa]MBY0058655.1 hypothetical protein [Paenibacillus polymyxa]MBY0071241.1 hypothetical protein [Paenibacillus polymyxa]MBY0078603.1 hypothetical protein [Paenibacillus polymyxa]MBZ6441694.1 hypothetical protein [Paenibacillus polymyxa]
MSERTHVLVGNIEKSSACNGRGYTESENHPDCPRCSGAGYVERDGGQDE